MMNTLLILIYVAFISLGLPDSLLGSGWPVMRQELMLPLSGAGLISATITAGTIISALLSERLTLRLGTGKVTAISVAMTACALFGFSTCRSMTGLLIWAIPYGLGAGAVDAALNQYVALHYSSRHMSWLHCFWGVGVTISPCIMNLCLTRSLGWQWGYRMVSILQVLLTGILFVTLPKWGGSTVACESTDEKRAPIGIRAALRTPGVPVILLTFFCYCAAEAGAGLWAASYLVQIRSVTPENAALFAGLYYLGITGGRFLSGLISERLGDRRMILLGCSLMVSGILLVLLPLPSPFALVGLLTLGLGCAPVYPSVIHQTPALFGTALTQAIVGLQMACAYCGSALMPPVLGLLAEGLSLTVYPWYLLFFAVVTLLLSLVRHQNKAA